MRIHIPSDFVKENTDRRSLFILVRPFWKSGVFLDNTALKKHWGLDEKSFHFTPTPEDADMICLPLPLQEYFKNIDTTRFLKNLLQDAFRRSMIVYGYVSGDFGEEIYDHPQLRIFRMGGFHSQLSSRHQGFPVALSDHLPNLFVSEDIAARDWKSKPVIGFCGHASTDPIKSVKEHAKTFIENTRRFFQKPFRRDYEPLFASALERARLLRTLESSLALETNFIYRRHYRAGARNEEEQRRTTIEYYANIRKSDYVVCVRGGGNFSVRFYETLMMGRIPVFINTDCLLPFPEIIPWKEHMVWVEWQERHRIAEKILDFHGSLSPEKFIELQHRNRRLWKETLSVAGILSSLRNHLYGD